MVARPRHQSPRPGRCTGNGAYYLSREGGLDTHLANSIPSGGRKWWQRRDIAPGFRRENIGSRLSFSRSCGAKWQVNVGTGPRFSRALRRTRSDRLTAAVAPQLNSLARTSRAVGSSTSTGVGGSGPSDSMERMVGRGL